MLLILKNLIYLHLTTSRKVEMFELISKRAKSQSLTLNLRKGKKTSLNPKQRNHKKQKILLMRKSISMDIELIFLLPVTTIDLECLQQIS